MVATETVAKTETAEKPTSHFGTVAGAALGAIFEIYEFTLYAATAGILAKKFYSGLEPSLAFLFALLTFGIGFVVRPFGAVVFGKLGDTLGRKRTFLTTMILMGTATSAVGVLPTYASAGVIAPILLVSMRILQGLAFAGEYGGSIIYVMEHVPRHRRGFSTAFLQMIGTLGFGLALLSIELVQLLFGQAAFDDWAWRVPFLMAIVLLALSLRVRLRMHESPVFAKMAEERRLSSAPVRETFSSMKNIKLMTVALVGIGGGMAVVYYNAVTYPLFFLTKTLGVPVGSANFIVGLAAFLAIPMMWFAGWLSDWIGRKPVMLAGFFLGLVATFPVFHQIAAIANPGLTEAQQRVEVLLHADPGTCSFMFNPLGNRTFSSSCDIAQQTLTASSVNYTRVEGLASSPTEVHVGDHLVTAGSGASFDRARFTTELASTVKQAGFVVASNPSGWDQAKIIGLLMVILLAMSLGYAPVGVALAEMFPARIRFTAMSVPYHFAAGWIGGLLPTFAFAIAVAQGNIFAGLWYTICWLIVGIVVTGLFYREPKADPE